MSAEQATKPETLWFAEPIGGTLYSLEGHQGRLCRAFLAMVHLVPSRTTYTACDLAELMFAEVYRHHGLPRAIISDRDVLFTSLFWTHILRLMGPQSEQIGR